MQADGYLSPTRGDRKTGQPLVDEDTGYRTPELSKVRKDARDHRREAIGTMSSFFKRSVAAGSQLSEDSCGKLI